MQQIFKNAKINGILSDMTVENGKILSVEKHDIKRIGGIDLDGHTVIPGFIDIHSHGCLGKETNAGDVDAIADYNAKNGTTTIYPTTTTVGYDTIRAAVTRDIASVKGAKIPGFHLEGPFLSEKYKGAQNAEFIKAPDATFIRSLPNIKIITVAPEVEGGIEFISEMKKDGIVTCIGHTNADYDTSVKAIRAGSNCLTHTCNAMPPLLHRAPGPIGAGADEHIYAQVIGDGLHLHYSMIRALVNMYGKDRIVFISDAILAAGMPDGEFTSGGQPHIVKNNECRLPDGTLAGSTSPLLYCARTALKNGFTLRDVIRFACENPARLMKLRRGKLAKGYDADFIVTDDSLSKIVSVYIDGNLYE